MSQSQDLLDHVLPYAQKLVQRTKVLPLFTLGISASMIVFYLLTIVTSIYAGFSLKPSDLRNFELSRLTTYPLIHSSFVQIVLSMAAFVPLCSRFETKFGTARSLAMFLGPFESVPGLLYCFIDGVVLRRDGAVAGCFGFALTMLSIEATQYATTGGMKQSFTLAGKNIPPQALPFMVLVAARIVIPGSSILLHLAAIAIGFIFGSGRVDFLLLPLKIVNFVEGHAKPIIDHIPNYITAEAASTSFTPLPTTEPGGYRRVSDNSANLSVNMDELSRTRTVSNPTKPTLGRQVSTSWTASQRED